MQQIPTIADLRTKRGKLMEEVNKLDIVIEFLSNFSIDIVPANSNGQTVLDHGEPATPIVDWSKTAPLTKKVIQLLQQAGRFMYVREIADAARKKGEPEHIAGTKANLQARISVVLSVLRTQGKLVRVQLSSSAATSVWGLPEWAVGSTIKDQHKPMNK